MGRVPNEQLVGRTIAGKFVVESLIGSGAMGAVFRARQVALEKTVAIKVLHGEHADDPAFAARFHREAKAASRLNHPNSMHVIDFGAEPDGLLYIAMEYLDGRSLHRLLHEEGPLRPERIADILLQTLAALAVAHDMGVVHRDLKPENIVVLRGTDDDGRPTDVVKVCDFGIAKISDSRAYRSGDQLSGVPSNAPVTTAGLLVGTPEYMSPEQGRGERLDARSDLYSVGVVLYEMLAGQVPFHAESALGVVLKHLTEVPVRPSEVLAGVDPRLEAICVRALRKVPADRYQTAREMRIELRAVSNGRGMLGSAPDLVSAQMPMASQATTHADIVSAIRAEGRAPALPHQPPHALEPTKPTLVGTSSPVQGPRPQHRRLVVTAILACAGGLLATAVLLVGLGTKAKAPLPVAGPPMEAPRAIEATPISKDRIPELEPAEPPPPAAAVTAPPALRPSRGSSSMAAVSTTKQGAAAAAVAVASPGPSAVTSTAQPPPSAAPPPPVAPPPAVPPPLSETTADPTFDPATGYVEVGLINAQGVRESAVRGAMRGVALSPCYRAALVARGARATGVARLNLSIDENGVTRSAIVTGADFLPGLARCLQGVAAGLAVPKAKVDPGGGTVEITLALRTR